MDNIISNYPPIPFFIKKPLKKRDINANDTFIYTPPKPVLMRTTNSVKKDISILALEYDLHLEMKCQTIECEEVTKYENINTLVKDLETFGNDFMIRIFGDFTNRYDFTNNS